MTQVGGASGAGPREETTERPRRGDPSHQNRMKLGCCPLRTSRGCSSAPLLQCVVCDGQTVVLAPLAMVSSPSSRPGQVQRKPRKVTSPLCFDWSSLGSWGLLSYPSMGRPGALSTAQPPRSPLSRGPRAQPPCRWSGWGGCGISLQASGEVSAR